MIADLRRIARRRLEEGRRDAGFTLVELLIALVLSGIIAGVIVAAMATSLNVASATTKLVADSTDAGLISAFLYRDAQAAGATDPSTTQPDESVGVSTSPTPAGWSDCVQDGSDLVVRLSWLDPLTVSSRRRNVVTYALNAAHQFTRRFCASDAAPADLVLGNAITAAVATCAPDPSCGTATTSVALTLTGTAADTPFSYTLTASLRTDRQGQATLANSSVAPLLALSAAAGTVPCPKLSVQGARQVKVMGDVVAGSDCDSSPIEVSGTLLQQTGLRRTLSEVADPFLGTPPPATNCGTGTNPAPIGDSSNPSSVVMYPSAVSITGPVEFKPGRYVFCNGLTFDSNATITGTDVFLFVLGGTFDVAATATVNLSAATTGSYSNLLVWVATSQQISIGSGTNVSTYRGFIYAPTSQITVSGAGLNNIGGIIGRGVMFDGSTRTRVGLPVPALGITPNTLPTGQKGLAYPPTILTANGGTAPYTWSASGLPDGITLDPIAGVLSGSPSGADASSTTFVVTIVDATSTSYSMRYTLDFKAMLSVAADPPALLDGQVGVIYPSTTIAGTGGTPPYTFAATGLPAGLDINATTGVISGSPTGSGPFSVTVTVTDSAPTPGPRATAVKNYPLTIRPMLGVVNRLMPGGQVGVAYQPTTFTQTGGLAPYVWSATGLPTGLTMNPSTGTISGTPTTSGSFTIVVKVTDASTANGTTSATTSAALVITSPLSVGTTAMPGGQVGVVYKPTTLVPTGGTAPFTWSAEGLPAGLTLDGLSGVVSGTPTAAGTFTVVATVIDATQTSSTASYTVTIVPALAIAAPDALPVGQVGVTYSTTTVSPAGGTAPFTWAVTGLPDGLDMNVTTGVISGTPTAAGSFSVGVSVTDAVGATAARIYPLTIRAALAVTTMTMVDGEVGVAYATTTFSATGGLAPYIWSATGLPAGLSMGSSTGTISGTPTTVGVYTVVVTATDAANARATTSAALAITAAPTSKCLTNPVGWLGEYYKGSSLSGPVVMCRDDAAINFNWGNGSPSSLLPNGSFSTRWTRTQNFAAGTYTFAMGTEDGGRLYIDGTLVLDRWWSQVYPSPVPTVVRTLTAGAHTIVMEYFEKGSLARATLQWTLTPSADCPTASGWQGEYFANATLTGPVTLCRDDPSISFNWGSGSPAAAIPADNFSVRWTRTQSFAAGSRTFSLGTDDGGRLYVDGVLVIDRWNDQTYPSPLPSAAVQLSSGAHTIVVEYYERAGSARATLSWS